VNFGEYLVGKNIIQERDLDRLPERVERSSRLNHRKEFPIINLHYLF